MGSEREGVRRQIPIHFLGHKQHNTNSNTSLRPQCRIVEILNPSGRNRFNEDRFFRWLEYSRDAAVFIHVRLPRR